MFEKFASGANARVSHKRGADTEAPNSLRGAEKSVALIMRLFEYFDQVQRAANAHEIGKTLGVAPARVAPLLREMCELGYLAHEPQGDAYSATVRVGLLGHWIQQYDAPGRADLARQ